MNQKSVGNCCFCVPLRLGVGAICLYHFLHAFVCIIGFFSQDIRWQSGGYNRYFERAQVFVGCFGLWFALSGLLGLYDNKAPWIKVYNWFQYIKLFTLVVGYVADMWTLRHCNLWYSNVQSQITYNPAMDNISSKGLCDWVRLTYTIGWLLDVTMNAYFAFVSSQYVKAVEANPAYMILFPEDDLVTVNQNHLNVTFFDERMGEPGTYHIGNHGLQRPTEKYGAVGDERDLEKVLAHAHKLKLEKHGLR